MRKILIMSVLCLAGVFLNMAIYRLFQFIGIPLYMDTVLIISITLAGGFFWGAICGVATSLIANIFDFWGWEAYLFIICNIATAYVTWLFVRFFPRELNLAKAQNPAAAMEKNSRIRNIMDKIVVLILLSFALCISMSILGGTISTIIMIANPPLSARSDLAGVLATTMFPKDFPLILEEILSRIPINSIDRLISAFGAYGIALPLAVLLRRLSVSG